MLNVRISGYYKSGKENVDFNQVVTMPECANGLVLANVQNRVVHRVFKDADKPYSQAGKCWVDDVKKDDKQPAFASKTIKSLDWDDIQELAIAYDLGGIPLYRSCSLREALAAAYRCYCNKVKKQNLEADFDYGAAPDFALGDKKVVKSKKAEAKAEEAEVEETEGQAVEE